MRILYSAIDQRVPSHDGGSVHVMSVAEGLARLGHDVHVLASPGSAAPPAGAVTWTAMAPPFGSRRLRLLRAGAVFAAARVFRPDVIIERYYNFGGEGVLAARRLNAMAVLEINAPVSDYPGSPKRIVDKCLVIEPLRRWREWQCRSSDLIVTPSARIIPPQVPRAKIFTTEWGADTTRFHPDATGAVPFQRNPGDTIVVFAGAFRAWHGAVHLVDAIRRLRARGRTTIKAVLVGDGPELSRVRQAAEGIEGVVLLGAVPHSHVPAILAAADIGAAPFDVQAHRSLAHEFHWSPLKVFEYMSSGLPVVAPRIDRLATLVCDGTDGILYDAADPDGLAAALERLSDRTLRRQFGAAARAHAVRDFSWDAHCRGLQGAIQATRERMTCAS